MGLLWLGTIKRCRATKLLGVLSDPLVNSMLSPISAFAGIRQRFISFHPDCSARPSSAINLEIRVSIFCFINSLESRKIFSLKTARCLRTRFSISLPSVPRPRRQCDTLDRLSACHAYTGNRFGEPAGRTRFSVEIYGQPIGPQGYDIIDSVIFAYWMPAV
jgi:hypothetical protein